MKRQRFLVTLMSLLLAGLTGFLAMSVMLFGSLSATRGLPVMYRLWGSDPGMRTILLATALIGGLGAVAIGVLACKLAIGAYRSGKLPESLRDYVKLWTVLWPLLGVALICAVVIPTALRAGGRETRFLYADQTRAPIILVISSACGAVAGVPIGFYVASLLTRRLCSDGP